MSTATERQESEQVHAKPWFMGWDEPVLPRAAERLFAEFAKENPWGNTHWDMREVLVVLPSSLAQRRLSELLAVLAQQKGCALYPPTIVTLGALPEQLYVPKLPFASDVVQVLAWASALQHTRNEDLQLLVPHPPSSSATPAWLELGRVLAKLHLELASDRLDFAKVAGAFGRNHVETPRWQALARIERLYLDELSSRGLWDVQSARLVALEKNEAATDRTIVVIGCVDLNRTQRGFLSAVAKRVCIWVAAPEVMRSGFDSLGCIESEWWQGQTADVPSGCLLVGNSPSDQAELVAGVLAELDADARSSTGLAARHVKDVSLGVADADLIPELQRRLTLSEVRTRFGAGVAVSKSEPVRLLALLGEYLREKRYAGLAKLVRHPAVGGMIWKIWEKEEGGFATGESDDLERRTPKGNWMALLDDYYDKALPGFVDGFVREGNERDAAAVAAYRTVTKAVDHWLSPLADQKTRPISQWVTPLRTVIAAAYGQTRCDLSDPSEERLYEAAKIVCEAIDALDDIPTDLQPRLNVSDCMDWLIHQLSGQLVPEPHDLSSIEMLGWLDLAWDDAPVLVIAGLHDGVVPGSVNADAFLPNQLRRQLGMMDNARRLARDLYSLNVMLASREHVRIVVGKTDADGNPLVPSRLLLACDLAELPSRVLHLVQEDSADVLPDVERLRKPRSDGSDLAIPRPEKTEPPKTISVTAFRDFLKCPYRFYLRHVQGLRSKSDEAIELEANRFGDLVHEALNYLGESPVSQSHDPNEVSDFLIDQLQTVARREFGPNPPVAVQIQLAQAQARLKQFAVHQAKRAEEGWVIRFTERGASEDDGLTIGLRGELILKGRIDRIDYHPQTGHWAIWDYKTSESAKDPFKVHWTPRDGWQDLQLPLYVPIATKVLGVDGPATVGYIALPKRVEDIGFRIAPFDPVKLNEALVQADQVATQIANCEFWPKDDIIKSVDYDDYARICQARAQRVEAAPPHRKLFRFEGYQTHRVPDEIVLQAKDRLNSAAVRTPIQLDPLLIRASAGTGKTFQLSNRLLQILLSGQDVDSILATTFTRKAAGEILQRVLQRLALGCVDPRKREELAKHLPDVDTSAAACLATLRRVTASVHRLRIGTLDSFFAQLASTFALDMDLPTGWTTMEPASERSMQLQAISEMLQAHDRKGLSELLHMLFKGESNRRVADEILSAVHAGYTIYRSTNKEAWDQLPQQPKVSEAAIESALRTLEACKLGHKSADGGLEKLHAMASQGDWAQVLSQTVFEKLRDDQPKYYGKELPGDLIVALNTIADQALAELLPLYRAQTLATHQTLESFDQSYKDILRRTRQLAFSDIAHFLSQWIDEKLNHREKEFEQLEHRMDCRIGHLLLDEFQDTSLEQWNILQPLAEPLGGQARGDQSFFCVGDSKQAIYGWRGGVAAIFESVVKSIAGLKTETLHESYRSSPLVMQAVNEVFLNLDRHTNYGGCDSVARRWKEHFPKHDTARKSLAGYVLLENGLKVEGNDLTAEQKAVAFLETSADRIAELVSESSASVGVLFRTNDDVARMIALLRDRGIPASQDGGNPLTDSPAVELILSFVHLADHPGDGACRFHVAKSPLDERPSSFRRLVSRQGLGKAIESVADSLAEHLSWWDQQRVEQLVRMAYDFEETGGRLREFERWVEEQRVAMPNESQVQVMTIHKSKGLEFDAVFLPDLDVKLTDGRNVLVTRSENPCEAPDGVLRYVNSDLQEWLPENWKNAFQANKESSLFESLCMLYVAMTRARQSLYMFTRPAGKNPRQDFGSLLQSTLAPDSKVASEPGAELASFGDRDWFRKSSKDNPKRLPPTSDDSIDVSATATRIGLTTDPQSAPLRGLPTRAPSQTGASGKLISVASAFSPDRSAEASSFGNLIHAFFAQVKWIEDFSIDKNALQQVAIATLPPDELARVSIPEVIDYFANALNQNKIRELLSRERYERSPLGTNVDDVQVDTERAISSILDGHLVQGTMDRLVVLYDAGKPYAAEIIDYKSSHSSNHHAPRDGSPTKPPTQAWLTEQAKRHGPQLELYAQVLSQQFGIPRERITAVLVMLASGDCISIT